MTLWWFIANIWTLYLYSILNYIGFYGVTTFLQVFWRNTLDFVWHVVELSHKQNLRFSCVDL